MLKDMKNYIIPSTEVQLIHSAYTMQSTHVGSTGGNQEMGQAPKRDVF